MSAPEPPTREVLVAAFRTQARGCAETGSPIYAELLIRAAGDVEAGGAFAEILTDYRGAPVLDALPLRVLGAVHEKVLAGAAPGLAAYYPSAGGRFDADGAWQALLALISADRDVLRSAAARGSVQTNEVDGEATLLFQSVVWWYIPKAERQRIRAAVAAAGARATPRAPLAWLRMEGANLDEAELRITSWPGGEDRLLGHVHWHGAWVRWAG